MNTINTIITIERDIAPEPPDSLGTELVPAEVLPLAEPFAREAAWIRAAHAQIGHDHLVIVARSIGIGEQLERIKAALDKERYGEWGRWVKRNLRGISERTLRRYREIFRRKGEPLAHEDPQAFLAQIYGNIDADDDTPTSDVNVRSENDNASEHQDSKTDATSNRLPEDGKKSPPSKRTRKTAAVQPKDAPPLAGSKMDAPPPIKNNPPPPSTALDRVPFETARERVADAIEEMGLDWKSQYGEPLLEHPGANPRVAGELEEILAEFDLVLETIVERLRSLGS